MSHQNIQPTSTAYRNSNNPSAQPTMPSATQSSTQPSQTNPSAGNGAMAPPHASNPNGALATDGAADEVAGSTRAPSINSSITAVPSVNGGNGNARSGYVPPTGATVGSAGSPEAVLRAMQRSQDPDHVPSKELDVSQYYTPKEIEKMRRKGINPAAHLEMRQKVYGDVVEFDDQGRPIRSSTKQSFSKSFMSKFKLAYSAPGV